MSTITVKDGTMIYRKTEVKARMKSNITRCAGLPTAPVNEAGDRMGICS